MQIVVQFARIIATLGSEYIVFDEIIFSVWNFGWEMIIIQPTSSLTLHIVIY